MSSIFEELEKIEFRTKERIEEIEKEEELRRLEEKERAMRDEAEKNKAEAQKRILEIIENTNLELDEPKLWTIKYSLGNPITCNREACSKTIVMTDRQKMLLEETGRLKTLVSSSFESFESINEISERQLSDLEKARLEGIEQKIELLKTSNDPALDEKGIYKSVVAYNGEKYEHWLHFEDVETEMTLRQALLVTTPETRDCFKTYTQIKEDKERLEEERREEKIKQDKKKTSKITFKSIKKAIKNKLNIR